MIERAIQTAVLIILGIFASVFVIVKQGSIESLMLIAAVASLFLINRPKLLLALLLFSGPSSLVLSAFGGGIQIPLEEAMLVIMVVFSVLQLSMKRPRYSGNMSTKGILIFAGALMLVIAVRGAGMRIFSGQDYGGRIYIVLMAAIVSYVIMPKIELTENQCKMMIAGLIIAACLPLMAQLIVMAVPQALGLISRFMNVEARYFMQDHVGGVGASMGFRLHGAGRVTAELWPVVVAIFWRSRKRLGLYMSLGVLLLFTMLSGFRGQAVGLGLMSLVAIIATSRSRPITVGVIVICLAAGYMGLLVFGSMLPIAVQRALSFIPGPDWNSIALVGARDSTLFRLKIWEYGFSEIGRYLFLGRGLLIENVYQHAWFGREYYSSPEFYYASHAYHSGPLSLLLDTGLLGLIGFLMFQIGLIYMARDAYRASLLSHSKFVSGYLYALWIIAGYRLFSYYVLFGDIRETVPRLIALAILIRIIGGSVSGVRKDPAQIPESVAQSKGIERWTPELRPGV